MSTTMQSTGLPFIGWAVTHSLDNSENGYGSQWDGEVDPYGDAYPPVIRSRGAIQRAEVEAPVRFRLGDEDEWCASGVVSAEWIAGTEDGQDPVYASLIQWAAYEYGCADVYFDAEDLRANGRMPANLDNPTYVRKIGNREFVALY